MQTTLVFINDEQDHSLLTLYEAKLGLNMSTSSTETLDDQLEMLVKWSSDEIAVNCNRTFAKVTVRETFRELTNAKRLYVAAYPIIEILVISSNGVLLIEDDDYEVDADSGTLIKLGGFWSEPVIVTYTGGYDLPNQAPDALKQAAILLTRESYYATIRGDASIKLVAHKESRVGYFDPLRSAALGGGGKGGSPARKTIDNLLQAYTRFVI
jgi:hypothetical protein